MPLNEEQQRQLEELERLRDEPEPPGSSTAVQVVIDLSDEGAVQRALEHGFLRPADLGGGGGSDDDDQDDDDQDDDGSKGKPKGRRRKPPEDEPPKRGGYFKEKDE